jgi:hypothetical protein
MAISGVGVLANKYCRHCGQELSEDSRFCPNCGRSTQEPAHVPTPEADVQVPPPPRQRWQTAAPPPPQVNTLSRERSVAFKLIAGSAIVVMLLLTGAVALVAVGGSDLSISSISSFGAPRTADEVLQALKDKGLPIGESEAYTAKNDPNELLGRPNQYSSKVNFKDTRLKTDLIARGFDVQNGGSIEVFENQEDAIARKKYLETVQKGFSPFSEYSYREGNVLLRLSHRLTPEQAAEYKEALKSIV